MSKLILLLLSLLIAYTACERKEERLLPKTELSSQLADTDQSRVERDEFITYAQKEIDELAIKVKEFRKKSSDLRGKAKENFEKQISALEREHKRLEENLATLKAQIGEKWKELKSGVTENIEQLKRSIKEQS